VGLLIAQKNLKSAAKWRRFFDLREKSDFLNNKLQKLSITE